MSWKGNKDMQLSFMEMSSPVGILKLVAHDHALVAVLWENENPKRVRLAELIKNNTHPVLLETAKQLNEYFQGKRTQFDLPLDFAGGLDNKDILLKIEQVP